jgi:hypothetical protein
MPYLDRSGFIHLVKARFPELKPAINAQRGSLGFEMQQYTKVVQRAIGAGDHALVKECFQLVATAFETGNRPLKNAISAWFLDDIDVFGANAWARNFLGPLLVQQLAMRKTPDGRVC